MSNTNTGGPAFPNDTALNRWEQSGMTLRDYFAAKAMRNQPLWPSNLYQAIRWALGLPYECSQFCPELEAQQAYKQADAMLKARDAS